MNNRFAIIMVALVAAFGGIFWFTKKEAASPTNGQTDQSQQTKHLFGEGKSGVTLVEYGDFECPGCGAYYPVVKQLKEKYQEQFTFQFVNFPLSSIHQNAMVAHRAAEAADKQGKFWEMHDMLYESQSTWNGQSGTKSEQASKIFEGYAQQLGLNIEKFNADRASSTVNDAIQADIKKGQALKITGTPTFYLDGKKLESPGEFATFSKLIDDAIAAKKQQ